MLYQILFSPQVKRYAIITNKHGIYELPQEFPNDLRYRRWGGVGAHTRKKDLEN